MRILIGLLLLFLSLNYVNQCADFIILLRGYVCSGKWHGVGFEVY